ncbi:hypothetical protein SAMN05421780_107113 [Flexibacter flexilis DSM 6793]|uniref:Uncharacterized protein n=1 Tax=Flexibacter flexilis DSM 6793 TaxID=927664 RepID=A0A1I1KVK7_9BACT|nr:hypothetical protein SAMN05421780_107113 [Flexibacter flexilis DSM 6793]
MYNLLQQYHIFFKISQNVSINFILKLFNLLYFCRYNKFIKE